MIRYYLYKIFNIIGSNIVLFVRGLKAPRGVSAYAPKDFKCSNKIVLAFWDKRLVHLGDQLFHQPIVEWLVRRYDVFVCGDIPLAPYFTALGVKAISLDALEKEGIDGAIFISKNDMAFDVFRHFPGNNMFVGVDYGKIDGDERIVVALAKIILDAMHHVGAIADPRQALREIDFEPAVPDAIIDKAPGDWASALIDHPDASYVIFNNYVASGHREIRGREHFLTEIAKKKREEGCLIVHTGSKKDKENDPYTYDFIDVDMRGALTPLDMFTLFSLRNVKGFIGFDAYVMHVASLFRKDLYIVIKSQKNKTLFRKRFVPMYPGIEQTVKRYW